MYRSPPLYALFPEKIFFWSINLHPLQYTEPPFIAAFPLIVVDINVNDLVVDVVIKYTAAPW